MGLGESVIIMKVDVEVIGNLGHAYLPHVYDEVSLSAPLKGHQIQLFKSLPVAEVLEATEERSLKELYCFYILDLRWTPNRAAVL